MTRYVYTLSEDTQEEIREELRRAQLSEKEIEIAMSGRVCDIEDVIDITRFL